MALRVDVNKGPLTLTHDPRPRDLKTSNNTSTDNPLYQDFRFKGYPSEGFFNPHNPQYKRNSAAEMNGTDTSRYFGKTQHFDTGFERAKTDRPSARPRATPPMRSSSGMDNARPKIDEGHKSLQYGSNDPRIAESQQVRPGPMRGMDFDRGENDRDRLRKEMVETEQDRQRIRYQEQLRMRDRDEERKRHEDMLEQRRQDMEMLKNYNPWGRPGGGAPMADTRKQKFTEYQLDPSENTEYKDKWEPAYPELEKIDFRKEIAQDRVGYDPSGPRDRTRFEQMKRDPAPNADSPKNKSPFESRNGQTQQDGMVPNLPIGPNGSIVDRLGTPGGGAPLRTVSGNHVKTHLNTAKIIHFQDRSRPEVENVIRYEKSPHNQQEYANDLKMQQKQESLRNQEEKLHTLKQELDHLKAAATDRRPDSFQERRQNGYGDSYERGGNPRTAPDTYRSATNPFEEYDNLGRTGKPRKPNMEMHPIYHPFGRSGGGAPVKDDAGKVNTILHGHSDRHYLSNNLSDYEKRQNAIKAKIYYAELGEQLEVQNYKRQKEKEEKRRPHGELAVIIDDKLTGKPRRDPITGSLRNHHLGNSDVSLQKMGSQPRNIAEQKQYHDFLDNMNEERSRKNALGKMKDFQEGKKHYDTMDNLWGRPGGGAPKGYTMRKFNLDEIIHRPTHDKATEEYVRKHDWSEVEPEKFFLKDDDAYYATQRSPRQNPMLSARDIQEGRLSPGSMPKKFIKSTVTSTHANMYDYREDYPQKDYRVGAPYATVNEG
ncbi:centrosome and spindle pole-associated protein 1-like isoform X21 [Crassostrea angulata]|uniref:centrosome and spindle pole-associated protein 1-like isoform X21 n=1 Tax=Magallana angulata TaxID=2784310 RepID=UPI0022B105FA|nr:centrosome and spindle pole-associated protein 1-like isoform X21 [Crassostrea angulata]